MKLIYYQNNKTNLPNLHHGSSPLDSTLGPHLAPPTIMVISFNVLPALHQQLDPASTHPCCNQIKKKTIAECMQFIPLNIIFIVVF